MPPKKNKKKNDDFEDYFFEEPEAVNNQGETKNENASIDPVGEDDSAKLAGNKKDKRKKKKGQADEDDMYNFADTTENVGDVKESVLGNDEGEDSVKPAGNKKDKKGKKKKGQVDEDDMYNFAEDDDKNDSVKEDEIAKSVSNTKDKKGKKKKGQVDEDDMYNFAEDDDKNDSVKEVEIAKPVSNTKDKKGKKKKGQVDEDDMYNFAEDDDNNAVAKDGLTTEDVEPAKPANNKKDKKSKKKKGQVEDEDDMYNFAGDDDDVPKTKTATASAPPPPIEAKPDAMPEIESDDDGQAMVKKDMKTAAEKKAEKKKRDADKRRQEKQKEEERLKKLAEQQTKQAEKERAEREAEEEKERQRQKEAQEEGEGEGEKEGKAAKAKKKKNAALLALQEELDRKRAEEERIRQEEEELQRLADEIKRQEEEKERLEKERKERKKQNRKENVERQKAEGTYLTKAQREQKAKMDQAREMFLKSGNIIIPAATTPGTNFLPPKRKNYKNKTQNKTGDDEATKEIIETEKKVEAKEKETWEDESEDDWEKIDENENDDNFENENESTKSPQSTEKVDELNNKLKDLKLSNGDIGSAKKPVGEEESSEEDTSSDEEGGTFTKEEIQARIKQRRAESEAKRDVTNPRAAVVCVLGHVDTGKTKILDTIRNTTVQNNEAGGITQQIGATNMPHKAIAEWSRSANVKGFDEQKLKLPGFLVIDTPGHESFTNLRSRGSSLCDLAILVVDIMHGLEPQTLESINLLKERQAPFVVALNKIDRLFEWKSNPLQDIRVTIKKQQKHTKDQYEMRLKKVISEFAEKCLLNVVPFWDNEDPATYVSICPTSAHTGDGMGNMIWYMVNFCQTYLKKRIAYRSEPQATVLEIKEIHGLGTTIDIILVNGKLKEGDSIVVAGYEGPIKTHVKALLAPPAMKELRVKCSYEKLKQIKAATGIKILARDVDKALAGMPMLVAAKEDEMEVLTEEMQKILNNMISSIKLDAKGVYVQASTLGSLEALLEFLKQSQIPYSGISIGPVHKKDVMKASIMLEHNELYGVILAFDVSVEKEAQDLADAQGLKIFTADIIYHLFDKFQGYKEELKQKAKDKHRHIAQFPCKLRILPNCIFNSRDPIIIGVTVESGIVKSGTQICVPSKEGIILGTIASLEVNNRPVDFARQGTDVCIKIDNTTGEAPKLYGRHFDSTDLLISRLSRESIDALKDHFRDEMNKTDWLLVKELKTVFRIV